jgi:hypothetical protein
MHVIIKNIEQRIRVWDWFEKNQQTVTPVQFLLALEYFNNYGYALDVACPLAMDSYKINSLPNK